MDLEKRKTYLGGTDASAVLGLNRWRTPLMVWMEKTGHPAEDISDKLQVKLGVKLEQAVADLFEEETGKKVHKVNETIFHPEYDFLGANIDRKVEGERAILECKTTSAWKAQEYKDGNMPAEYILQCLHYLMVTGYDRAYLAVLIGNQDFIYQTIERDDLKLKPLLEKEVAWWREHIVKGSMPTQIMAEDNKALQMLYPMETTTSLVQLADEASVLFEQLEAFEQDQFILEKKIDEAKNKLKAMIGNSEGCQTPMYQATWKKQSITTVNSKKLKEEKPEIFTAYSKSSSTRVFRWTNTSKKSKKGA